MRKKKKEYKKHTIQILDFQNLHSIKRYSIKRYRKYLKKISPNKLKSKRKRKKKDGNKSGW